MEYLSFVPHISSCHLKIDRCPVSQKQWAELTWLHICIFAFLKLRTKIISILVRKPFCRRFALQRGLWFTTRHSISVAGVIKQCELHVDAVILFLRDQQKPLYGQFYSRKMNTHFKSKTNSLPSFKQSNYGYLGSCIQNITMANN